MSRLNRWLVGLAIAGAFSGASAGFSQAEVKESELLGCKCTQGTGAGYRCMSPSACGTGFYTCEVKCVN